VRPIPTADLLAPLKKVCPTVDDRMATARTYGTYVNETSFSDEWMAYPQARKRRRQGLRCAGSVVEWKPTYLYLSSEATFGRLG
jgi:hypothetical protein